METSIFPTRSFGVGIGIPSSVSSRSKRTVICTLTPPVSTDVLKKKVGVTTKTPITVYKDTYFDRLAIDYLSKAVQDTIGIKNEKTGYESLVVAATTVFRRFDPIQQRQLVITAIQNAIPTPFSIMVKTLLPPSKFSREYFAAFTTIFFQWLIGSCEVKESVFEGRKEKNVVHIKKCRFLESANCAGMCTNLCKIPSQEFIKNSFGVPMTMVPNFDDMSCEMIFGQNPPALQDDPALKQPCYKLCNVKHKHDTSCIN